MKKQGTVRNHREHRGILCVLKERTSDRVTLLFKVRAMVDNRILVITIKKRGKLREGKSK